MARQISEMLPALRVVDSQTEPHQRSTDSLQRLDLAKLPRRLNDAMIARLEAMVNCHLPPPQPCPEARFIEVMIALDACLARQTDDGISGEIRTRVYRQMLGEYTFEAMKYLEREALKRCKFFPTIAECLAILREYPTRNPLAAKRDDVLRRISQEHTTRFDEAMARLAREDAPQEWIDALPETWKRIAETRSLLWEHPDGSYTIRRRRRA